VRARASMARPNAFEHRDALMLRTHPNKVAVATVLAASAVACGESRGERQTCCMSRR